MQTIYAMSDIHGMINLLKARLSQLDMNEIRSGKAKLVFLGDYIDRGLNSIKVMETIRGLQNDLGENVIALKGNHDQWFLDFLFGQSPYWIDSIQSITFLREFLNASELGRINHLISRQKAHMINGIVRGAMETRYKDLLSWMKSLRLFYETEHQIFVHAGVDEEAGEFWQIGSSDEIFYEKYPATTGDFYKDIIAGHVSVSTASGDRSLHDIYYDGHSHFFIDGIDSYPPSVKDDECTIPLLKYVEEEGVGSYFSVLPDGGEKLLCSKNWSTT